MNHKPMLVQPEWMTMVRTKEGNLVLATPKRASFNGRHNMVKAMALIVLYARRSNGDGGITAKALSIKSTASYRSLLSLLPKWVRWSYVQRKAIEGDYGPIYSYSISKRGEHFLEDIVPKGKLAEYTATIRAHNAKPVIKLRVLDFQG